MAFELPFTPGETAVPAYPLSRFLPPVPGGMVSSWLRKNFPAGSWLLDPMCSTPHLALEAARAGYRVLVASNNPILSFMLEILARAPARSEFVAAFAALSAARRGAERLEIHFRNLYASECAVCHHPLQPQAFLWRKGETQPFGRWVRCPNCGDEGERPLLPIDLEHLTLPGNPSLHLARALERIALPGDPLREGAQDVAQFFLARPLYFLTTLINHIEGLSIPETRKRLLAALALSTCDEANSLWPYPEGRSRPRQLTIPPVFREKNLWEGLEAAIDSWCLPGQEVPLVYWPNLPPESGGICLAPKRLRALTPLPGDWPFQAVISVLPRPNQAFWTLSAAWSGWLWGREALTPLRNALERQRYDWHWHAQALHSVFSTISQHLPKELPVWGIVPELVPGFLSATILAAETAGLHLNGLAVRSEDEIAQILWKNETAAPTQTPARGMEPAIQKAIRQHFERSSEPSPYLVLHSAGLEALAEGSLAVDDPAVLSGENLTRLQNTFLRVFKSPHFKRFERQPSQNIETGLWWLDGAWKAGELTLADRVEMELVRWLFKNPGRSFAELESWLCEAFPGLLTPSSELIQVCLESYASATGELEPIWQLRPTETPTVRRADLETIRRGLERLGKRLGYSSQGEAPLVWKGAAGEAEYWLYPIASAVISRHLLVEQPSPPERSIFVVPGSRVNLILFKQRRDPRLADAMAKGWRLLKFRQLRQILDQPNLSPVLFESLLDGDPPRWEQARQLTIL